MWDSESIHSHNVTHVDTTTTSKISGLFTESSMESAYIHRHLGEILAKCLAEVMEKRPKDPIEYMAQWIYKYRENELRNKQVDKRLAPHTIITCCGAMFINRHLLQDMY